VRERIPKERQDAMLDAIIHGPPLDYTQVHCPVLAFFAEHALDVHAADLRQREQALAWEKTYFNPFQDKSIERLRRELAHVEIIRVPDSRHISFFYTRRREVVQAMRRFLESPPGHTL
jgi:hypothetical protein